MPKAFVEMEDGWRSATASGYVLYADSETDDGRRYTKEEAIRLLELEKIAGDRIVDCSMPCWRGSHNVLMLDYLKPLPHKLTLDHPPAKSFDPPVPWWRRLCPFRTH